MKEIRTLIVDDDPAMCLRLKYTATRRGLVVQTFQDALAALEAHAREPFELIILDWMMPDMDGLELCRRARRLPQGDLPVILMVTACNQREDLQALLNAGADDYLAKPFDEAGLSTRLTICEQNVAKVRERAAARAEAGRLQQRLLQLAREAGMAEVATSVLHNVGNVLNSVNVSAELAARRIRNLRVSHLTDVAALLARHENELGAFLARDEKGKQIVGFLSQLADHLVTEQQATLEEVRSLIANCEHIKDIVRAQQSYAGAHGVVEPCRLAELLEDAVHFAGGSLERYGIKLVRDYREVPPVQVDRSKVLQILVNIIKNAKEALVEHNVAEKTITLRLAAAGAGHARIDVTDNGPGIRPENLTKIFSHGFTTKKNGHGFGLHGACNSAREMGGSLRASSEGAGRGATFTLELPVAPKRAAVAPELVHS